MWPDGTVKVDVAIGWRLPVPNLGTGMLINVAPSRHQTPSPRNGNETSPADKNSMRDSPRADTKALTSVLAGDIFDADNPLIRMGVFGG